MKINIYIGTAIAWIERDGTLHSRPISESKEQYYNRRIAEIKEDAQKNIELYTMQLEQLNNDKKNI